MMMLLRGLESFDPGVSRKVIKRTLILAYLYSIHDVNLEYVIRANVRVGRSPGVIINFARRRKNRLESSWEVHAYTYIHICIYRLREDRNADTNEDEGEDEEEARLPPPSPQESKTEWRGIERKSLAAFTALTFRLTRSILGDQRETLRLWSPWSTRLK